MSFFLGLGSLVVGFLAGLPAVFTGHRALRLARKSGEALPKRWHAVTGLTLGYLMTVLTSGMFTLALLPGLVVTAGSTMKDLFTSRAAVQERVCVVNLKQLTLALRMYAMDYNDVFPASLTVLSNELGATKPLVCPASTSRTPGTDWATVGPHHVTYVYLTPNADETTLPPKQPLAFCPVHNRAGLIDGSVPDQPLDWSEIETWVPPGVSAPGNEARYKN